MASEPPTLPPFSTRPKLQPLQRFGGTVPNIATPATLWKHGCQKLQPLQHFCRLGVQNCNPYNAFRARGQKIAPTALRGPGVGKLKTLQHVEASGAGNCSPYSAPPDPPANTTSRRRRTIGVLPMGAQARIGEYFKLEHALGVQTTKGTLKH